MMGISSMTHWLAWFITYFAIMTVSVIIMVVLFRVHFPTAGSILSLTNSFLLFVFLEIYVITVITFSFFISLKNGSSERSEAMASTMIASSGLAS